VFLAQAVPPFEAVNSPAWSICAEAGAYLAFPVLALLLVRLRTARTAFTAAAAVAVVGALVMWGIVASTDSAPTSYGIIWLRILFEFSCGALIFTAWRRLQSRSSRRWDAVAVAAAVVLLVALAAFPPSSGLSLILLPLIALFVLSIAGSSGIVGTFLSTRFMRWGGRVSYSVYMTHFIVLMVVGKVLPWTRYESSPLPLRIAVILGFYLAVVAVGAAMYHFVEEPARKAVRRIAGRRLHEPVARAIETAQ
jgi:peptidoglycan/LPS O-acetylase OafA/YrhL